MLWQRLSGSTDFQLNSLADLFFGAWQRGRVADFPLVKLFIDGLGGVVSFVAILAATPVETRKHEYSKQTTVWSQSSCGGIVMQHFKRQVKLNFLRGPVFGLINSIGIWLSLCLACDLSKQFPMWDLAKQWDVGQVSHMFDDRSTGFHSATFQSLNVRTTQTTHICKLQSFNMMCMVISWVEFGWIDYRSDLQLENNTKSWNCHFNLH